MTVRGCARCGSDLLRTPSASDGVLVGPLLDWNKVMCNRCDFWGIPLEFDSDEERVAYSRSQQPS